MRMQLNVPDGELLWNVQQNCQRGCKQVVTHLPNQQDIAIVTGGPSLETTFQELQELVSQGVKTVAVNGVHDWLIKRGIRPSAMVMCDAREFNKRFVQYPERETKYFIASQCHPAVYDELEGYDVYQYHLYLGLGERQIVDRALGSVPWIVGGSTVGLRAIHLMRVLGFQRMHIFGMDSCRMGGRHHCYEQKENDFEQVQEFTIGERTFVCDFWHLSQMDGFVRLAKSLGDLFQLKIHGDGAIAHLVNYIAETGVNPLEEKEHGRECVGHF